MSDWPSYSSRGTSEQSTAADILRWTLTTEAVAPCFVKDVYNMKDKGVKDPNFFWLGRVPCRKVRLVGILVGAQVEEKRTVYTIDDSTGVIECLSRQPKPKPSPKKPTIRASKFAAPLPRYARPSEESSVSTFPKVIAYVGASVSVTGRVMNRYETRKLYIDEIAPCMSANDELEHWSSVLKLYNEYYFPLIPKPFLVPSPVRSSQLSSTQGQTRHIISTLTKDMNKRRAAAQTTEAEDDRHGSPTSVATSVTLSSPARSVTFSVHHSNSPPRLRHPSRLHTSDLTANTFRIYLKHYLDRSCTATPGSQPPSRSPSPSPISRKGKDRANVLTLDDIPETPRKRPRLAEDGPVQPVNGDETPRPSNAENQATKAHLDRTPRASTFLVDEGPKSTHGRGLLYGITLAHLRRVPELAELACRVVEAERRKRAHEERKRVEAYKSQDKRPSKPPLKTSRDGEPTRLKVKRLYKFAIRQLYEEGDIVLWDGPAMPLPPDDVAVGLNASTLWRLSSSTSLLRTSTSSTTTIGRWGEDPDEELSDPPPNEEAYISLTSAYFLPTIEHTILEIIAHRTEQRAREQEKTRHRSRPALSTLLDQGAPPPGPTPDELLKWLQRDERWARVGEWSVREALELGKAQGRVWCVGKDRWEVCG